MTGKQVAQNAKRLFRLCLVSGRVDPGRAHQAVEMLVARRQRGSLRLLRQFRRLLKLHEEQRTASVECAVPATPDLERSVRHRIESLYGAGISTVFAHNPRLIGGIRIRVGCDVFDGSILNGLTALGTSFGVGSTNGPRGRS